MPSESADWRVSTGHAALLEGVVMGSMGVAGLERGDHGSFAYPRVVHHRFWDDGGYLKFALRHVSQLIRSPGSLWLCGFLVRVGALSHRSLEDLGFSEVGIGVVCCAASGVLEICARLAKGASSTPRWSFRLVSSRPGGWPHQSDSRESPPVCRPPAALIFPQK